MRNYWVKIILGALAVFAVGMIVATGIRRVERAATTSETIEFPLAFIPFRVDGARLGEMKRVRIMRAAPDTVQSVHLRVALHDSLAAARLGDCLLVIRDVENLNEHTSFECAAAADTAGQDLVAFGTVQLGEGGAELPFLVPRSAAGPAHASDDSWERAAEYGDSIAEAIDERADSIADAAEAFADSLQTLEMERADSIRADGVRRADSVRAAGLGASVE
jgi:hypothetical protein